MPMLAMFLAGLGASVPHCAPMCGPFVLAQASARLARLPATSLCERHRIGAGLLLPYQLGRLTTYTALGAAAGSLGIGLRGLPWLAPLASFLLLAAALLFLAQALTPPAWRFALLRAGAGAGVGASFLSGLAARINRGSTGGEFLFGVLLGFLPCGLLYAALLAAAAQPHPLAATTAMLAFGVGTIPALATLGVLGRFLPSSSTPPTSPWARRARGAIPGLLLLAIWLVQRAA